MCRIEARSLAGMWRFAADRRAFSGPRPSVATAQNRRTDSRSLGHCKLVRCRTADASLADAFVPFLSRLRLCLWGHPLDALCASSSANDTFLAPPNKCRATCCELRSSHA